MIIKKIIDYFEKKYRAQKYWEKKGLKCGASCEIYEGASFGSEPYLITLGNHVRVNTGVFFVTHDGGTWVLRGLNNNQYKDIDLFEQVSEDIKNAMKPKDKVALETLRNVKKFFLEAKTAPGANDTLTDADALKIMQKLVKQGKDSATIYVQQGRQDLADVELEQVKVIEKYLPQQMSAEELEKELKAIIAQVGAAGPKDMGKVMGVASKALAGRAEGRMISETVKRLLN